MIKEGKVLVSVDYRNMKTYKDLGYDIQLNSVKDKIEIEVPIEYVNRTSRIRITAICEL